MLLSRGTGHSRVMGKMARNCCNGAGAEAQGLVGRRPPRFLKAGLSWAAGCGGRR